MTPLQLETLRQFRALGIRYLVVGGQAMRAMSVDRQTRDLDLWIARDLDNAKAMTHFLHRVQNCPPLDRLQQPNFKFTVGDPMNPEVDILTSVAGDPEFEDCFSRSKLLQLDGHKLRIVACADLLALKEKSAEAMDRDAGDARLNDEERKSAISTATKERRDIALLTLLLAAGG